MTFTPGLSTLGINTPIDCLPAPILSDIFILTCYTWDVSDRAWREANIRQMRIPYVLASVSRRWHAIAVSTSKIWDHVDLSLRPQFLATHLARSKNLPIDVYLILGENSNFRFEESLRILKEKNTWARMRFLAAMLGLERPAIGSRFIDAFNNAMDNTPSAIFQTISMVIIAEDGVIEAEHGKLHIYVPRSQALRDVGLAGVSLSPAPRSLPSTTLPQLKCLQLDSTNIRLLDQLLPSLELASNLIYLSLHGCQLQSGFVTTATPRPRHSILLEKLHTLKLDNIEGTVELNMAFQTLDMPNLRVLTFSDDWSHHDANLDWKAICHCRALRSLRLTRFPTDTLAELLEHIDTLGQLERFMLYPGYAPSTDNFAEQFIHRLFETSYCPKLRDLDIFYSLNTESVESITELRSIRPSLDIRLSEDESDNEGGEA
ncbi:hypothetical protein FRC07_012932, partial [Ceratobasidium sp. 392]